MSAICLARSGLNVAGASRRRGEVVDVDPDVADYLCSSGQAVRVDEGQAAVAVVVDDVRTTAERATARPGRRRPREPQK